MLRRTPEDAGKGGIPHGLQGGVIGLTLLQPQQPLTVIRLDEMNLLYLHLHIFEFFSRDSEAGITRIHYHTRRSRGVGRNDGEPGLEGWGW